MDKNIIYRRVPMTSWRRREHDCASKLEKLMATLKGGKNKLYPPHLTEESPNTNIEFPELRSTTATTAEKNKRTVTAARRSELITNLSRKFFKRFDGERGIYKEPLNFFFRLNYSLRTKQEVSSKSILFHRDGIETKSID